MNGWKWVPVVPTAEMIAADPYGLGYGRIHAIWSALVGACSHDSEHELKTLNNAYIAAGEREHKLRIELSDALSRVKMLESYEAEFLRIAREAEAERDSLLAEVAAARVPPAGGEVEVIGYLWAHRNGLKIGSHTDYSPFVGRHKEGDDYTRTELVDRAHVTRLTAENARLQAEVERLKGLYDTYCRPEQVKAYKERGTLKAEVERLQQLVSQSRADADEADRLRHVAQSELTEARELLREVFEDEDCPVNCMDRLRRFLAHQSAPAAKDGDA